jgi:probable HAF family extracellular repeat protein
LLGILAIVLAVPPNSRAQVGDFVNFDVPGASLTRPFDVNNSGVIVGRYDNKNGMHGFVFSQGVFTAIDFPGAVQTVAIGINDLGQIVGRFQVGDRVDHGFVLSNGVFHQIDFPGSIDTQCHGINKKGEIVGRYHDFYTPAAGGTKDHEHGFLLSDDRFSSVDFPDSVTTDAWKITDGGDIVGDWSTNGNLYVHGYVLRAGQFTSFDFPDARLTASRETNVSGQMVGIYQTKLLNGGTSNPGREHGFVVVNGSYTGFDFPGSALTDGNAINDSGLIVGTYIDSSGKEHGYTAVLSQY